MEEKEINIEELLKKAENEQEAKAPESEENANAEAATDTNVTEEEAEAVRKKNAYITEALLKEFDKE